MKNFSKRLRFAAVGVLAALAAVSLTALGAAAPGGGASSAAQYQYGPKKVTICHKGKTIRVSRSALKAHNRHGDTIGSCTSARAKAKARAAAKARERAEAKAERKAENGKKSKKSEKSEKSEKGNDGMKPRGKSLAEGSKAKDRAA